LFHFPRRPWCAHCRNNTHSTEDCPDLISKWEDHARKRGANLINYEPRFVAEGKEPNINIVTRGGTKTGVDIESPHQIKIQKVVPENTKYDPVRKKGFFKDAVEMFRQLSSSAMPEVVEPSSKPNPHQPRVIGESLTQMEPPGKSQKVVDLWLQLFSDILDDEQLTGKLWKHTQKGLGNQRKLKRVHCC
jgi:hypothetical protein